jgi:hypothetical protein
MTLEPPILRDLWDQSPPTAEAAHAVVLGGYPQRIDAPERRVRKLEERLGQNSTNSGRPSSPEGPAVKRRTPRPQGPTPRLPACPPHRHQDRLGAATYPGTMTTLDRSGDPQRLRAETQNVVSVNHHSRWCPRLANRHAHG